jgi:hypothetical protein
MVVSDHTRYQPVSLSVMVYLQVSFVLLMEILAI